MTREAKQPRHYPRAKVARMLTKAKQTIRDMAEMETATRLHRATDPYEQAKLTLQRRGIIVFNHCVLSPGSELVVVGTRKMTRQEVIQFAMRFACQTAARG